MQKNIGAIDRAIRVVIGLAIVYWAVRNNSWWGMVGVAILATATMQFCALYRVLGFSTCGARTCGKKHAKRSHTF